MIAFLMWKNKMRCEEAFRCVKQKSPIINPNPGFRKQLKELENQFVSEM